MSTIRSRTEDLLAMIADGAMHDAIDKYYADDVRIIEGNGDEFHGKETQKGRVDEWLSSVREMHGEAIRAVAVDDNARVSMVESWTDLTFHDSPRTIFEEIEVYRWNEDGKITEARFYYNVPSGESDQSA